MTLIQKLNDSIITNINIVESENRMFYDYNHLELAEFCEVIADEFAIGFADWVGQNTINYSSGKFRMKTLKPTLFTSKELLEIYKREKGL